MTKGSKLVWTSDPEEARKLRDESVSLAPAKDAPPSSQTIFVTVDRKKRRGKSVTMATGFVLSEKTLGELARSLKSRCGAGGTSSPGEIEVQGEHVETVAAELEKLGYRVKKR
ncbi:MAG TPA: translation initiation factor [Thermoanaerobaculia bacterium]|nr:translation initiation factor [Thermoanaerobaculia bacterium]